MTSIHAAPLSRQHRSGDTRQKVQLHCTLIPVFLTVMNQ